MIKNTSKYELGGLGENITQRFVRGDASRSTEGSGLGAFHRGKLYRGLRRELPGDY